MYIKENFMNTTLSVHSTSVDQPSSLRPLALLPSLAYFFIPGAGVALSFYLFRPFLAGAGYSPLIAYLASLLLPMALIFAAALVAYHKVENRPLTWQDFSARLRFPRLRLKDLFFALLILAACFLGYGLFSAAGAALVKSGLLPIPSGLPAFADPRQPASILAWAGSETSLLGRWDIALLYLVTFFFNIVGEELWWRGVILPRQELSLGRYTWLVHGILWALFHFFKYWDILGLLPVCLIIAFAAQKLKTNWPGAIAHALFNIGGLLVVLGMVAGWLR
jgi:membrane protease YdiL (CAAX protease family)